MSHHSNTFALRHGAHQEPGSIAAMRARRSIPLLAFAIALVAPASAFAAVSENFDGVTAPALPDGWTSAVAVGAGSTAPWVTKAVGHASSAPNALWADDVDDYADVRVTSPTYSLPATGSATITFHHSYVLWAPDPSDQANGVYSGGVLEVSINGGAFQDIVVAGGSFGAGGYSAQLDPTLDNPLMQPPQLGRSVWGGDSGGFVATTATLPASAQGGTIAFRWRLGTEGGGRGYATYSGWWVDDFTCEACQPAADDTIFKDGFDGPQ